MKIKIIICIVFLVAINFTDMKGYKIKNKVVLPMVIVGILNGILCGTVSDSICGMLIPLVLFPLYALKMLGAGDIKAFCALGAVLGTRLCFMMMIFSFIAGGIIAFFFMLFNKNFLKRFKNLFEYLKLCIFTKNLYEYNYGGDEKSYFRFSFAITAGTVLALINNYLCIL